MRIFGRRPTAPAELSLTRDAAKGFHAVGRAPKRSKPKIVVEHDDRAAVLLLDFGVGEPGRELTALTVTTPGVFTLPVAIPKKALVSVRGRDVPVGGVRVTVAWTRE
jgi:hypothetical protein